MQLKWLNAKKSFRTRENKFKREITANWSQRPEDKQRKTSSRQSPAENVFIFINFTVFLTHQCRTRILTPQPMAFPSSRFLSFINHQLTPFRTPLHEIFMLEVGGKHFFLDICPESWHIKLLQLLGPWIGLCFYCFWTRLARSTISRSWSVESCERLSFVRVIDEAFMWKVDGALRCFDPMRRRWLVVVSLESLN